jgi:hypothetical protein
MPTVIGAAARFCHTCGDTSGWVRWRVGGRWLWAACADCNRLARKPKPPICPDCQVTRPFCTCLTATRVR